MTEPCAEFAALSRRGLFAGAAALAGASTVFGSAVVGASAASTVQARRGRRMRNVYRQPFAATSIWNMPIGSGAVYKASNLAPATRRVPLGYPEIASDPENICLDPAAPLKGLTGGMPHPLTARKVHIPADLTAEGSWNNCTAFLGSDGRTIYQGQPLQLSAGGNGTMAYSVAPVDIYGPGITGSHGGSGLSGVGGSIRKGELRGWDPIRHALKLNVYGARFLSQSGKATRGTSDVGPGWMWPATKADTGFRDASSYNYYGGTNPLMRMGTLLAIPPSKSLAWITSRRAKRIARALKNYGAYVVDNTARDVHAFAAEKGAFPESSTLHDKQFHLDLMRVISMLRVVANNGPDSIGGGGKPRVKLTYPR